MQIAVISDIHGNWAALEAVLTEIRKLGIDEIICLGDIINPLPSSREILEFLVKKDIPIIRGNHEDYIITALENPTHPLHYSDQFKPIQLVTRTFDLKLAELMKSWPLKIKRDELLFCHASPQSNTKGWRFGLTEDLQNEILEERAEMMICGHWHDPKTEKLKETTLVTAGSVGLPLAGRHEAEFVVLSSSARGWEAQHLTAPFDPQRSIDEYVGSGWFAQGGPMAWLLHRELETAQRYVSAFFYWARLHERLPSHEISWSESIRDFLRAREAWEEVESLLNR